MQIDTNWKLFTVAAVADDIPANSNVSFDILGSYDYLLANSGRQEAADDWHRTYGNKTFVLLRPDSRLMKRKN